MGTEQQTSTNAIQLPSWAPTVFEAISKHGPLACIAVYLIWNLVSGNAAELRAHAQKLEAHAVETRDGVQAQIRILYQICVNTASTPEEKAACWTVGR